MRHLLVVAIALSLACGASDDSTPSPRDSQPTTGAPPEAGQKKPQAAKKLGFKLVWPDDRGPKRDVQADAQACRKELAESKPDLKNRPMEKFKAVRECMGGNGWIYEFL